MKLKLTNVFSNLINEKVETVSGKSITDKAQKDSKENNDEYQKEVKEKMAAYQKNSFGDDYEGENKFNATDKQKEYHDEMEILNGMEMVNYDNEPSDSFKERAAMALKGDCKMGNAVRTGKWNPETGEGNGNTESVWGASDDKFGEKLSKRVKSSTKKRNDAKVPLRQFGNDIEIATDGLTKKDKIALKESLSAKGTEKIKVLAMEKGKRGAAIQLVDICLNKLGLSASDLPDTTTYMHGLDATEEYIGVEDYNSAWEEANETARMMLEDEGFPGMLENKRLRFKKPFGDVETAQKVIPSKFKKDGLVFEMTDGLDVHKFLWNGGADEGFSTVVESYNIKGESQSKNRISELFSYDSKKAKGSIKAKDRLMENDRVKEMIDIARKNK